MRKFQKIFCWEAKRLLRFPLLEIFLVLVMLVIATEMFYVSYTSSSGSMPIVETISDRIMEEYGSKAMDIVRLSMGDLFIIMILTGCTLIGNFMAKEIENGTTKLFISHPIRRSQVFLSKYLVCFLTLAIVPFLAISLSVLMLDPRFPIHLLRNGRELLSILIITLSMSLYITSVSVACSVLSRNVAMSMLGSIGILLVLNIISDDYIFLPGRSFNFIYTVLTGGSAFSGIVERTVALMYMPAVGIVLFVVSYYVFTRRMELP